MHRNFEVLIPAFGEADDALVEQEVVDRYRERLRTFPDGEVTGAVATRNIGKGADWIVVTVSIVGLLFTIPKAHKAVRES